jgi:hypothetical protein
MENRSFNHSEGLLPKDTKGVLLAADTHHLTPPHHDSDIITTLVVKEHGGSLLIILPEATSRPAEYGNTIPPIIMYVFPIPYRSSKKILQVRYSKSYPMPAS